MQRLSSNFTLFLKIFVPVSWLSFFGLFGAVIFLLDPMDEPFLTSTFFRSIYVVGFILFGIFLYFTLFQLKRVETENGQLFVTDYFKTVRFPIENVKKITSTNLGLTKIGRMHLHNKGVFGSKIPFVIKSATFDGFYHQFTQGTQPTID